MRYLSAVTGACVLGLALLVAGQLTPSFQVSAVLNLFGGALLVVVAIRALAGWAGLHRDQPPKLGGGETVLVESDGVMVQTRTLLVSSRQGPYRARLTNRRLLLSLRVLRVTTQRDVTVAWLDSGQPLSVLSIDVQASGQVTLTPERRWGPRLRMWVANPDEWRDALNRHHPQLLAHESSGSRST